MPETQKTATTLKVLLVETEAETDDVQKARKRCLRRSEHDYHKGVSSCEERRS